MTDKDISPELAGDWLIEYDTGDGITWVVLPSWEADDDE
jgi:hypothetical protein